MKSKNTSQKKEKEKGKPISHKKLLEELSGLEVKLESKKPEEEAEQKEPEKTSSGLDDIHDLNFNGIDFNSELKRLLNSQNKTLARRRTFFTGSELEGSVASAPRVSSIKRDGKNMNYSETKYDANLYNENKYDSKTPDYTAASGGAETSQSGGTGIGFQGRAGRNSQSGSDGEGGNEQ